MKPREELIAALVDDLAPVKPVVNINGRALLWFSLSALYVVAVIHAMGPIRPGAFDQLTHNGRFLLENLLGLAAVLTISIAVFRASVPGLGSRSLMVAGGGLMLLWIAMYPLGFISPTLEPSMLGKREFCYIETLVYALPPIIAGGVMLRRLYPLNRVSVAWWLCLAAGMLPALYMQLACMYEPSHILRLHILPGLIAGLIGAAVVWAWRRRQGQTPK